MFHTGQEPVARRGSAATARASSGNSWASTTVRASLAARARLYDTEEVRTAATVSGLGPDLVAAGAAALPLAASHPSRAALAARQR
jgi:hypothetical protein